MAKTPKRSRLILITGLSSAALLLVLVLFVKPPSSASIAWIGVESSPKPVFLEAGCEAPAFVLPTDEGETIRLADFKGQRVALVFVTPQCPYCNNLEEQLEKFELSGSRRLWIISAGKSEESRKIRASHSLPFPILIDSTNAVGLAYKVSGVPTIYLIDAEGRIEAAGAGMPGAWELVQQFQEDI